MAKGSFGELLKRERELREISLNELTKATRVAPRFLEALENEQWDKLPGGVFNRGFVRAIARYLGLSEDHFLSEYDLARGGNGMSPATTPNSMSQPKRRFGLVVVVILASIAGLLTGGVYAWRRYAAHRAVKIHAHLVDAVIVPCDFFTSDPRCNRDRSSPSLDLAVTTLVATPVRVVGDG
jgi:cytoskeletal protein RodZ